MNTTKLILFAIGMVVILLATLFRDQVKAVFMGFRIGTDSRVRKNDARIVGHRNRVGQDSGNAKDFSKVNKTNIEGNDNSVKQD